MSAAFRCRRSGRVQVILPRPTRPETCEVWVGSCGNRNSIDEYLEALRAGDGRSIIVPYTEHELVSQATKRMERLL